jgi:hypothetical protein
VARSRSPAALDELGPAERGDDGVEVELEQREEGVVRDVPRRNDEQLPRRPREQVPISEVLILRDHYASVGVSPLRDLVVGRPVSVSQLDRMNRVVPRSVQERREPGRQLRVDQELHAADSGTTRRRPAARTPNSNAARMSSRSGSG